MATPRKILTIDGGGIRGVFAAAIVEQMEKTIGKPAREYFDCIYGTSTGAILAAGLAIGMSASELKDFYLKKGALVFTKFPTYRFVQRLLYVTYSKENLEKELKAVFKSQKIFDLDTRLSLMAKDAETNETIFFNNFPHTRKRFTERNLPLWRIIRASTAAPSYFQAESDRYIDGGISAYNNTSYAAFIGATKYLRWPAGKDGLRIYSVGTGYLTPVLPPGWAGTANKKIMAEYVINAIMHDVNVLQNQIMKRLMNDHGLCWYKRFNIQFDKQSFTNANIPFDGIDFETIAQLDAVDYVKTLAAIGELVGKRVVRTSDFPE